MVYLDGLVEDREEYASSVFEKQQQSTAKTLQNMAGSVQGEACVKGLTWTRDGAIFRGRVGRIFRGGHRHH
jgi:hypothetical protein